MHRGSLKKGSGVDTKVEHVQKHPINTNKSKAVIMTTKGKTSHFSIQLKICQKASL